MSETPTLYVPTKALNLRDVKFTQIRLGLQGEPGYGKTFSAMTFPNITVADFDSGMNRFAGTDCIYIPFHSDEYVRELPCGKSTKQNTDKVTYDFANRRDAFIRWLQVEGLKLTNQQTLLLDSWTAMQNAFDIQQDIDPPKITQKGEVDDFYFWQKKIEYAEKIVTLLKACHCHVVVTFHEDKVRDKNTGVLLDKVAPLMQGKFTAQIKSHFTDWFRAVKVEAKNTEGKVTDEKYYWQVRSDNKFDAKTKLSFPKDMTFVEPHFKIFEQYSKPLSAATK